MSEQKSNNLPRIILSRSVSFHKTIKPPNPPTPPIFTLPNTPPTPPAFYSPDITNTRGEHRNNVCKIAHKVGKMKITPDDNDEAVSNEDNYDSNKETVEELFDDSLVADRTDERKHKEDAPEEEKERKAEVKVSGQRSKKPTRAKEWRLMQEKKRTKRGNARTKRGKIG